VHVELNTDDLAAAKTFYRKVFDWKLTDTPMGGGAVYTMLDVGTGVGGGMQVKPMPDAPTMWLPYVLVDNVKKTLARAGKNGAHIIVEYMEVMGMGALGIFIDPTGAPLGVWQAFMPEPKPAAKKKAATTKKAPAKRKPAAEKKATKKR
jgi:uncharacterized protein